MRTLRFASFAVRVSAGVFLVLCSSWVVAWAAARALVVEVAVRHADVVLVFAGGPLYRERVLHAAQVFLAGRADTILLTDDGVRGPWSRTLQRNPLSVERGVLWLTETGVPRTRIEILPGRVRSTYDEAMALRRYAESRTLTSVLAVTSRHHCRRALLTLRHVLDPPLQIGIEAAHPMPDSPTDATWFRSARGWSTVAAEYVKLPYYRLRYL